MGTNPFLRCPPTFACRVDIVEEFDDDVEKIKENSMFIIHSAFLFLFSVTSCCERALLVESSLNLVTPFRLIYLLFSRKT